MWAWSPNIPNIVLALIGQTVPKSQLEALLQKKQPCQNGTNFHHGAVLFFDSLPVVKRRTHSSNLMSPHDITLPSDFSAAKAKLVE